MLRDWWGRLWGGRVRHLQCHTAQTHDHHVRFFNDLAHDLRSPLAAVVAELDLLSKLVGDQPLAGPPLNRALAVLGKVSHYLDDAVTLGSDAPIHRQACAAAALTTELLRSNQGLLGDAHLALAVSIARAEPGAYQIATDPSKLERILGNLLANARQFTPPGGTVRVELARVGNVLRWAVEDSGPGVPPGQRERIFGELVQLGNVGRRGEEGHGMGLAIARRFAEQMGGKLWCEGGVRLCGARFVLELPVE